MSPIGVDHSARFSGNGEWIVSDRRAALRHSQGGRAHPEKNRCSTSRLDVGSRSSAQFNDGQMFPAFQVPDDKHELGPASSPDLGLWRRA